MYVWNIHTRIAVTKMRVRACTSIAFYGKGRVDQFLCGSCKDVPPRATRMHLIRVWPCIYPRRPSRCLSSPIFITLQLGHTMECEMDLEPWTGGELTNPGKKREEIRHSFVAMENYPVRLTTSTRRARSPYFRLYCDFLLWDKRRGNGGEKGSKNILLPIRFYAEHQTIVWFQINLINVRWGADNCQLLLRGSVVAVNNWEIFVEWIYAKYENYKKYKKWNIRTVLTTTFCIIVEAMKEEISKCHG